MKIFVRTDAGKVITLIVGANDTIETVKSKIRGTPPHEQRLFYAGKQLKNDLNISFYNIREKSLLELHLASVMKMKILVKTLTGKTITLSVEATYTIEDVKNQIQHQCPKLTFAGKQLEDDHTLSDYNIVDGSTLHFTMDICVHTLAGKTIHLEVTPSDSIKHIKSKIQEVEGIPARLQRLIHADKDLKDDYTLSDYGVKKKSALYLVVHQQGAMQIFVKTPAGKTTAMEVKSSNAVESIKSRIGNMEGVPPENLELFFGRKQLEHTRSLSDYLFDMECAFHMLTFHVCVSLTVKTLAGRKVSLKARASNTVRSIKSKIGDEQGISFDIQTVVSDGEHDLLEGIPPHQQALLFNGNQLEDELSLFHYGIPTDSTLELVPVLREGMQLLVTIPPSGRTVTLEVEATDTVDTLKSKIQGSY